MTNKQIAWAAQHDWFIRSTPMGTVVVRNDVEEGVLSFDNYLKLRAWAGY